MSQCGASSDADSRKRKFSTVEEEGHNEQNSSKQTGTSRGSESGIAVCSPSLSSNTSKHLKKTTGKKTKKGKQPQSSKQQQVVTYISSSSDDDDDAKMEEGKVSSWYCFIKAWLMDLLKVTVLKEVTNFIFLLNQVIIGVPVQAQTLKSYQELLNCHSIIQEALTKNPTSLKEFLQLLTEPTSCMTLYPVETVENVNKFYHYWIKKLKIYNGPLMLLCTESMPKADGTTCTSSMDVTSHPQNADACSYEVSPLKRGLQDPSREQSIVQDNIGKLCTTICTRDQMERFTLTCAGMKRQPYHLNMTISRTDKLLTMNSSDWWKTHVKTVKCFVNLDIPLQMMSPQDKSYHLIKFLNALHDEVEKHPDTIGKR